MSAARQRQFRPTHRRNAALDHAIDTRVRCASAVNGSRMRAAAPARVRLCGAAARRVSLAAASAHTARSARLSAHSTSVGSVPSARRPASHAQRSPLPAARGQGDAPTLLCPSTCCSGVTARRPGGAGAARLAGLRARARNRRWCCGAEPRAAGNVWSARGGERPPAWQQRHRAALRAGAAARIPAAVHGAGAASARSIA